MNKFREHACGFKNEDDCEEELDQEMTSLNDEEAKEFGE
jgi:hypothetical protein